MEQHKHCLNTNDTATRYTATTIKIKAVLIIYEMFLFLDRNALVALLAKQRIEMISIVRLSIDLTHAVSTLPKGWFWGGKLKTWHVGALGTISAMIGIYQYFAKKKLKKA